jgi:hypothetical protein
MLVFMNIPNLRGFLNNNGQLFLLAIVVEFWNQSKSDHGFLLKFISLIVVIC